MRFLIDADLPRDTSILLASYGHVGVDVRDIGMGRAEDPEIAGYALQNKICLISGDWGFSDIRVYRPEDFQGIVVIGTTSETTGQTKCGASGGEWPRYLWYNSPPMRIHITCDCGQQFDVGESLAGLPSACPACQKSLEIPGRPQPESQSQRSVSYSMAPIPHTAPWTVGGLLLVIAALGHAALLFTFYQRDTLHQDDYPIIQVLGDAICVFIAAGLFKRSEAARLAILCLSMFGTALTLFFAVNQARDIPGGPVFLIVAGLAAPIGWTVLLYRRFTPLSLACGSALLVLSWMSLLAIWLNVR